MVRNYVKIPMEQQMKRGVKPKKLDDILIRNIQSDFSYGLTKRKLCEKYNISLYNCNRALNTEINENEIDAEINNINITDNVLTTEIDELDLPVSPDLNEELDN